MNLKLYLLVRMALVAIVCWLGVSVYIVASSGQQMAEAMARDADQMQELFEVALLRQHAGQEPGSRVPSLRQVAARFTESFCLRYQASTGAFAEDGCGAAQPDVAAPRWLVGLLTWIGRPPTSMERDVRLLGQRVGTLTIAPDQPRLMVRYWNTLRDLLWLTAVTVMALGTLTFWVIDRALRPTQEIVATLDRLAEVGAGNSEQGGRTGLELPIFQPLEFGRIAVGINRLSARLTQVSAARNELMARLIRFQEDERRELAHDLHNELGQCVAALPAISATLRDMVALHDPLTEDDFDVLDRTIEQMQGALHSVLVRMRPPLLESRGLTSALNDLMTGWRAGQHGAPEVVMAIGADVDALLSQDQALCVYRVIQECLNNIARHARESTAARIDIRRESRSILIGVSNDIELPLRSARLPRDGGGMGLPLLTERLHSQGGHLVVNRMSGRFSVLASLPLDERAQ